MRARQQRRQRGLVAERVIAGIVFAEQADIAGNGGGDDRHACGYRFGHHVRAAFHAARDHHRVAAREPAHRTGVIEFAQPAIARLGAHQRARLRAHFRRHRLAKLHHADRALRQVCERLGGAKRVFLIAQVADHGREEIAARRSLTPQRAHRLVNHPGFRALGRAQFVQALGLQDDHAIGQAQGRARVGVAANVAVKIGAGEHQRQGAVRMRGLPRTDRRVAAARVQCDQDIGFAPVPFERDLRLVAQRAQMPRPAQRGIAVAVARTGRGRRYNDYAQRLHCGRGCAGRQRTNRLMHRVGGKAASWTI